MTEFRLVGGKSKFEGRVEIKYNSTWGTICDDGWGKEEKSVVCRSLGFNPSNTKAGHVYGGTGPIWLNNIMCAGSENSLAECRHDGWGVHNCNHSEDVAVVCKDISYRLVNGPGYHAGRLEVFFDNQWGTVCDHMFGPEEASVVCRQLGLSPLRANAIPGAFYGRGTGTVWLDHVACVGTEPALDKCIHHGWGRNNCSHNEDVSVVCQPASYRLVGSNVPYECRVEVFHDNQWGTLCDDGWSPEEMRVVCSSLGYNPTTTKAFFGNGTGRIWLDDIVCTGMEPSIAECQHSKWGVHNCGHHEDAAVVCKPVEYRLVGGSGPHEGRVEVFFNNEWGTICDNMWSTIDAEVVCNGRGFSRIGAEPKMGAFFGQGQGPIWLSDVACEGGEASISECTHSGWRRHNCTHANHASVICKYGPTELMLNTTNNQQIVNDQMVIDARDGEEVIVNCVTDCVPDCMIHWHKTNKENVYSDALSNNSRLVLSPIQRNQSGEYFCMAINPEISTTPAT
ncbi:CD5 antigen-like, partial [Patella vulgata]|uniref:CD5 antigen-like n=1 Tax=Patella vulgata TaxID=6465 RepID=UPI0024A8DA1D